MTPRGGAGRVVVALGLALALSAALSAAEKVVVVSPELRVSIRDGDEVFLSARPLAGEGLDAFVRRLTEDPAAKKEILAQNEGLKLLKPDVFVRAPYGLLSAGLRRVAMSALFPEDTADPGGWTHRVTAPTGRPESLWRLAEWFTGSGEKYSRIREANGLASLQTEKGQSIRIPADLLLPVFRGEAAASAGEVPLEYASDEKGGYAIYRLRKGEALYSAVVVRFTGRVHAEDVNQKAAEIAERSGIAEVRSIPVAPRRASVLVPIFL